MSPSDFAAWVATMRSTRGWRQVDCARALGVQPRQIIRWRKNGAPPYISLAIAAVVADMPRWAPQSEAA